MNTASIDLRDRIRDVPDFPTEESSSRTSPLIADPEYFSETIRRLADWARPREPDLILGAEARGVHLRLRARVRARRRVHRRASRASSRARPSRRSTPEYGTDSPRCIAMPFQPGLASSCSTTCSRPEDCEGEGRARGGPRRRGRRHRVRARADVPARPRQARRLRRARARLVLAPVPRRRELVGADTTDDPVVRMSYYNEIMYDPLTSTYAFSCPHGARLGSRSPRFVRSSIYRGRPPRGLPIRFACGCGGEHPGLIAHDDLDWAHLGTSGDRTFRNFMTAHDDPIATELVDLAVGHIGAGEWPWSFFLLEGRPRPVTPSAFMLIARADGRSASRSSARRAHRSPSTS